MIRTPLQESEIAERLKSVPAWVRDSDGKAIRRLFVFGDFSEAFGFMTRAALAAETLDHHPEWTNVYRKVDIRLTTHSAKGLTALDFDLAERLDRLAGD